MLMLSKFLLAATICLCLSGCVLLLPFIENDGGDAQSRGGGCWKNYTLSGVASYSCPVNRENTASLNNSRQIRSRARLSLEARVDQLIAQLSHRDPVVRTHATSYLAELGPKARKAVQPLSLSVKMDSSKWVRRGAVKALGRIGDPRGIDAIRVALHDKDKWVAHSAQRCLQRFQSF